MKGETSHEKWRPRWWKPRVGYSLKSNLFECVLVFFGGNYNQIISQSSTVEMDAKCAYITCADRPITCAAHCRKLRLC